MDKSVVIACRNGAATLAACLASIEPEPDQEVIVVDDGSTDGSGDIAERSGARVIRREPRGRAAALNAGIRAAAGRSILFTDADCVVGPGWSRSIARRLDEGFDGVGGNLVPSAWTVVETAKVLRYLHEFESDAVLEGRYTRYCLNGNNMAIRKTALEAVGGFDESYIHGADADLTRRLLNAGFRLLRTRDIETRHLKIDSLRSFLRTFHTRGSAVRFAMDRPLGARHWVSAFAAPLRRLVGDYARTAAMKRRFPDTPWTRLLAAPWAHLLADWQSARGQMAYYRAFR